MGKECLADGFVYQLFFPPYVRQLYSGHRKNGAAVSFCILDATVLRASVQEVRCGLNENVYIYFCLFASLKRGVMLGEVCALSVSFFFLVLFLYQPLLVIFSDQLKYRNPFCIHTSVLALSKVCTYILVVVFLRRIDLFDFFKKDGEIGPWLY